MIKILYNGQEKLTFVYIKIDDSGSLQRKITKQNKTRKKKDKDKTKTKNKTKTARFVFKIMMIRKQIASDKYAIVTSSRGH